MAYLRFHVEDSGEHDAGQNQSRGPAFTFPDMKFLSSVNDLGVVLDERLEMEEQIGSICRSGFYHLRQIRGIRRSLSDVAARSAVQAFIMSKVDYCNSALLGLSATMVDRVQRLMNAAPDSS